MAEWRGEPHSLHASARSSSRASSLPLPLPPGVEIRAGAGGDGDGLVAARAFATGEEVWPWETPLLAVSTGAAGAVERLVAGGGALLHYSPRLLSY